MTRKELIKLAAAEIVRSEMNKQAQAPDWGGMTIPEGLEILQKYVDNTLGGDDAFYKGDPLQRLLNDLGEGVRSDSLANEAFNNFYNTATGWLPDDAYSHITGGDSLSSFADSLGWARIAADESEVSPIDWYNIPSDQREALLNVVGDYTMPDELVDLEY